MVKCTFFLVFILLSVFQASWTCVSVLVIHFEKFWVNTTSNISSALFFLFLLVSQMHVIPSEIAPLSLDILFFLFSPIPFYLSSWEVSLDLSSGSLILSSAMLVERILLMSPSEAFFNSEFSISRIYF